MTKVEEKVPGHDEPLFLDWMEGFLAGEQADGKLLGPAKVVVDLPGFGAHQRFGAALEYCREHPDAKFYRAAAAVFEAWRARPR